jgi:hypothetical protein
MQTTYKQNLVAAALVGWLASAITGAQAEDLNTHFGPVTLDAKGYHILAVLDSGRRPPSLTRDTYSPLRGRRSALSSG